jgi:hypothetical protein
MSRVLLRNIKKGQKFYWDDIIYTMENCEYDMNVSDKIQFTGKIFKRNVFETIKIACGDAINYKVYRFTQRDLSSFNAGFRRGIKLISNKMLGYDLEQFGIDNDLSIQIKMLNSYRDWKLNKI